MQRIPYAHADAEIGAGMSTLQGMPQVYFAMQDCASTGRGSSLAGPPVRTHGSSRLLAHARGSGGKPCQASRARGYAAVAGIKRCGTEQAPSWFDPIPAANAWVQMSGRQQMRQQRHPCAATSMGRPPQASQVAVRTPVTGEPRVRASTQPAPCDAGIQLRPALRLHGPGDCAAVTNSSNTEFENAQDPSVYFSVESLERAGGAGNSKPSKASDAFGVRLALEESCRKILQTRAETMAG
jgi:hypothetical protein